MYVLLEQQMPVQSMPYFGFWTTRSVVAGDSFEQMLVEGWLGKKTFTSLMCVAYPKLPSDRASSKPPGSDHWENWRKIIWWIPHAPCIFPKKSRQVTFSPTTKLLFWLTFDQVQIRSDPSMRHPSIRRCFRSPPEGTKRPAVDLAAAWMMQSPLK